MEKIHGNMHVLALSCKFLTCKHTVFSPHLYPPPPHYLIMVKVYWDPFCFHREFPGREIATYVSLDNLQTATIPTLTTLVSNLLEIRFLSIIDRRRLFLC